MASKGDELLWKAGAAIAAAIVGTFLNAFALTKMWGWFIVPLGVASIGMAHAWGLTMLISWLTNHSYKTSDDQGLGVLVGKAIIYPLFVLLFGSLAFWMM